MPEYLSGKKRKQSLGVSSYSENKDTASIIGNVLVSSGKIGVGTTLPTQDVDVETIRVRDTLYDSTNSGGVFGYYLVKDTGGIKWVAVPPIDSNAIFIAQDNNILGVSSFTGLNIISDDYIGVSSNPVNTNFADIRYIPSWVKNGELGIYTSKNVGIGTSIPTADFQVGVGTTGVTIDGASGVVSALGYYGKYAFIDNIVSGITTINDTFEVVGVGTTLVAVKLASFGGITTTGGDLYVGGTLFSEELNIINLEVVNINSTGVSTFNQSFTNVGVATTFIVTGIASINDLQVTGVTTVQDLFAQNINVVGVTTTDTINANVGVITNLTTEVGFITNLVSVAATIGLLNADTITGVSTLIGIGSAYFPFTSIDNLVSLASTITILDATSASIGYQTGIAATFTNLNATSGIVTNLIGVAATINTLEVDNANIDYQTGIAATFTNLNATSGIVTNLIGVNNTLSSITGTAATITNVNSTRLVSAGASFIDINVSGISTFADVEIFNSVIAGILTVSELDVEDEFNVYANNSVFHNNLVIQGSLTVNGTETIINTEEKYIKDRQIVLGYSTTNNTNDLTANGGGIAIASSVGTPLVPLYAVGVNTLPNTYKQFIWTLGNTYGVGTTDAFMSNYAIGIGSTLVPNGVRLAVGGIQLTDNRISVPNILSIGIATFNQIDVTRADIDNLTGIAASFNSLKISGITTLGTPGGSGFTTTLGDLYVGGNLYTKGSQYFDSIGAEYLDVTGIGSINNANINYQTGIAATITNFNSTNLVSTSASFTNLRVTGVATYNNGPVLIGSGTSTGTAEQPLQVTGNSYFSGNVGVGTTLTNYKLDVIGDARVTGIVSATIFIGSLSGNSATSDYADYADISGISTNVIGGIGSISRLIVSGVSSFTSGPVIIGGGVSTGTINQPLQVTGGSYFSGDVGFGSTTPTQKVDIRGGIRINGQIYDRFNSPGSQGAVLTSDPLTNSWYWAEPPPIVIGILTVTDDVTYYPALRSTGLSGGNGIGSASYLQIDNVNNSGFSYKINPARLGIGTTNPTTKIQLSNTLGLEVTSTGITTTVATTIDTLSATFYRSARFQVQITQGSSYQVSDVLVIHDGTTATLAEYASIATGDYLGDFSSIVSGGSLLLRVALFSATSATVKVARYGITI